MIYDFKVLVNAARKELTILNIVRHGKTKGGYLN